jgi:hypothetical protein
MTIKEMLESQGFLSVALPNADISPLQILQKSNHELKRRNDNITFLFESSQAAPPPVKRNIPVAGINGTLTLTADINASLSFLDALKNLIGVNLALKFEYKNDDQLVFAFESPTMDEITSFGELDRFMNTSVVVDGNFGTALKSDDFYIITSTLKSKKFSVGIVNSSLHAGGIDLPNIKGLLDSDLTLDLNKNEKRGINYEGDVPLIFGVQAAQILYNKPGIAALFGKKGSFRIKESTGLVVRSTELLPVVLLKMPDQKLRLI